MEDLGFKNLRIKIDVLHDGLLWSVVYKKNQKSPYYITETYRGYEKVATSRLLTGHPNFSNACIQIRKCIVNKAYPSKQWS